MSSSKSLRTVSQITRELPAFTEASLRRLVFNSEHNGLARAIVRIGRRVYIDRELFEEWVELHRGIPYTAGPSWGSGRHKV